MVLIFMIFRHGSMVYAALLGMHILEINFWVTANIRDMNPKSISTAPDNKQKKKELSPSLVFMAC